MIFLEGNSRYIDRRLAGFQALNEKNEEEIQSILEQKKMSDKSEKLKKRITYLRRQIPSNKKNHGGKRFRAKQSAYKEQLNLSLEKLACMEREIAKLNEKSSKDSKDFWESSSEYPSESSSESSSEPLYLGDSLNYCLPRFESLFDS